jgi:hypothetical protein
MPTSQQAAANRANSSNSSGHSATEGKAASRYNAAKHGIVAIHQIMFDESVEDLAELAAEYHEHHSPADPDQRLLVDTLIANEWRLRRMRRVEAVLPEHAADAFLAQHPEAEACNSSGAGPCPAKSATRSRARRHPRPSPIPATPTIHNHFHEIGFVPSKSEKPASGSPQTTGRHAACQPARRPARLGEPRENLVKTLR